MELTQFPYSVHAAIFVLDKTHKRIPKLIKMMSQKSDGIGDMRYGMISNGISFLCQKTKMYSDLVAFGSQMPFFKNLQI